MRMQSYIEDKVENFVRDKLNNNKIILSQVLQDGNSLNQISTT